MASSQAPPIACLLALALCLLSSLEMASSSAKADFSYLTLTWPGGYCGVAVRECCYPDNYKPSADFLVLEGMETYSSATGRPVTYCNTTACKFSVNPLFPVITELTAYWPILDCPPSKDRKKPWIDSWCKYGYCTNLTEVEYFNRTLLLREEVNLLVLLGGCGIVPSESRTYKLEDIQKSLLSTLGSSTVVECTKKRKLFPWWEYDYFLSSIRICVSLDGRFVIGCPIRQKSSCPEDVWFLPNPLAKVAGEELAEDAINPMESPYDGDVALQ